MTSSSTTIRVSLHQRSRLQELARTRSSTMTETLDAALESLHRDTFYRRMAEAEAALQTDPEAWAAYVTERDEWLDARLIE